MSKLNQRGAAHLLLPLLLLAGIIAGVWLITNGNPLKLFSKAGGGAVIFKDIDGKYLPSKNNIPQTTSPRVKIELYSTLGPPYSVSAPVSKAPSLVGTVYAQSQTKCPGECADANGKIGNQTCTDWLSQYDAWCKANASEWHCFSSCSSSSTTSPPQDAKACPGGIQACGGSNRDNLGSCSTGWDYPGSPEWNNWCYQNAGGADAYCYSCTPQVTPPSSPIPDPDKCPGSCGNSDRTGLGSCSTGWEYTPKYNASCGSQKYCYVCTPQNEIPTPQPTTPPDQPPPPSPTPNPTSGPRYTISYRFAEDRDDLDNAAWIPYTQEPEIINRTSGGIYEFLNQTPGFKFIWVEFQASDGTTDRQPGQIELIVPGGGTGSSFGKAVKFNNDASNNAYLVIKPVYDLNAIQLNAFTLEGWINTPKPSSGNYLRNYSIATLTKSPTIYDYGYTMRFSLETEESSGNSRPMFSILLAEPTDTSNRGNNYISVGGLNSKTIPPNTWIHVLFNFGVTEGNKCSLKMFINGVLWDTVERIKNPLCKISNSNLGDILVAKPDTSLGGISGYYYPGLIDDIRLYQGNAYLYGNFTPPTSPFITNGSTKALYHFDGDVNDSSSNGNNGQLFGNVQFIDSTIGVTAKRVFVTSTTYSGNLGGLSGADAKCQASADAASLGGTWKAWLSDTFISASSRFARSDSPYKLLDGRIIADNWSDLTDGSINHAINLSEYKSTVDAGNVWTNTTRSGEINKDISIQPAHCQNWTDSTADKKGSIGSTWSGSTNHNWTESGYDWCVNPSKRLFCFEQ